MTTKVTDKQRRAMEHMERAREQGMALSDYARAQGISAREIYDAVAALRRKGALPPAKQSGKSAFLAVRVAPRGSPLPVPSATRGAIICRLLIGGTAAIECADWPPVTWLSALMGRADAAA